MWFVLFVGSGPGLLLLCCFLARRNANLAGGFAGRPVWVLFLLSIATLVFDVQLEPKMCSNFTFMLFRPIFRTEPLSFIGRTREKKELAKAHGNLKNLSSRERSQHSEGVFFS